MWWKNFQSKVQFSWLQVIKQFNSASFSFNLCLFGTLGTRNLFYCESFKKSCVILQVKTYACSWTYTMGTENVRHSIRQNDRCYQQKTQNATNVYFYFFCSCLCVCDSVSISHSLLFPWQFMSFVALCSVLIILMVNMHLSFIIKWVTIFWLEM